MGLHEYNDEADEVVQGASLERPGAGRWASQIGWPCARSGVFVRDFARCDFWCWANRFVERFGEKWPNTPEKEGVCVWSGLRGSNSPNWLGKPSADMILLRFLAGASLVGHPFHLTTWPFELRFRRIQRIHDRLHPGGHGS